MPTPRKILKLLSPDRPVRSLDPVLEYHVLLLKLGGADGVIVTGTARKYLDYGPHQPAHRRLVNYTKSRAEILHLLRRPDRQTKEQWLHHCGQPSQRPAVQLYLQTNFFSHASYLQFSNKPVLLNFGPIISDQFQWVSIFSVLSTRRVFTGTKLPSAWRIRLAGHVASGGRHADESTEQLPEQLRRHGNSWPGLPAARFPAFTILTASGAGSSYGYLDDRSGATFRETLRRAP